MRLILTLALLLGAACSFYAPAVNDCTLACTKLCPDGFSCRGGWCRANGAKNDCECAVGDKHACGSMVGECKQGLQTCLPSGTWSECVGEVKPAVEVCDGKDNDCDGLTDLGPVKLLLDNNTGPYEGHWRLHASDAGYVVVTPLTDFDGGADYRALRYDPSFEVLGRSNSIITGEWRRADSMILGTSVYVSYWRDLDVDLTRVTADGTVKLIATFPDAGYDSHMQVGASAARGVTSSWIDRDGTVRIARWQLTGAAPWVYDLAPIPDGTVTWLDATTDGRFSVIEASMNDGGQLEILQDNDDPTMPRTTTAPYWSAQRFITRKAGTVVHLDILTLDLTGDDKKVAFWRDYEHQSDTSYFPIETAGRWHDSDFTLDTNEDVVAAYVDETTQRFVLARIEGTSSTDEQVTRRVPEDNVVIPLTNTAGNVRVARVPGDPMFGLVWSTRKQLFGRRFCAP
jgi:hypothetical protein